MDYQLQEYLKQIRSAFSNYGVAEEYRFYGIVIDTS